MFDFEKEYKKFRPLVLKMYRTFIGKTMEQDDFEQEARIVLWRTLLTYDEDKGWTKGTCFRSNLRRWVYSNYRKQNAHKRTNLSGDPVDFVREGYDDNIKKEFCCRKLDDYLIDRMKFNNFLWFFVTNRLTKKSQTIFFQWFGAQKKDEECRTKLVNNEQLKRKTQTIKRKFVSFYKKDYGNWQQKWIYF